MHDFAPPWPDAPRLVPDAQLPLSPFLGGRQPHPRRDSRGSLFGLPVPPPGLPAARWREDRAYLLGIDLYHQGFPWEAHEQWEACLAASEDSGHRLLLQSLIQLAASLIQAHRKRRNGAQRLATAARAKLVRVVATTPEAGRLAGLDPRRLLAEVEQYLGGAQPPRLVTG
jgi:hypothetical protein